MVSAVVDRIIDGEHAVLLVGTDEVEYNVPISWLPEGVTEGTWLRVRFVGDKVAAVTIDNEATQDAKERIAKKMDLLRRRGRS